MNKLHHWDSKSSTELWRKWRPPMMVSGILIVQVIDGCKMLWKHKAWHQCWDLIVLLYWNSSIIMHAHSGDSWMGTVHAEALAYIHWFPSGTGLPPLYTAHLDCCSEGQRCVRGYAYAYSACSTSPTEPFYQVLLDQCYFSWSLACFTWRWDHSICFSFLCEGTCSSHHVSLSGCCIKCVDLLLSLWITSTPTQQHYS